MRNQIALTQQKLQLFSHRRPDMTAGNPFGAIGYRQKREVENELKSLFTDLNRLLFTPPPIFTEMIRGDQGSFFRDPGLQTSGPGITVNVVGQPSGQKLLDTVNQRLSENGFGQFV